MIDSWGWITLVYWRDDVTTAPPPITTQHDSGSKCARWQHLRYWIVGGRGDALSLFTYTLCLWQEKQHSHQCSKPYAVNQLCGVCYVFWRIISTIRWKETRAAGSMRVDIHRSLVAIFVPLFVSWGKLGNWELITVFSWAHVWGRGGTH